MSRKVSVLLEKLSQTDVDSPEFLALSKQIAETYKEYFKNKMEKKAKPKAVKVKNKRTIMCDDCSTLLLNSIKTVLPALDEPEEP
jgi:ATP-dependent protease HslVU (ClpYQ) ATPase subunit